MKKNDLCVNYVQTIFKTEKIMNYENYIPNRLKLTDGF